MAKKKKASTPLPQTLTSSNETLVNNTLQNSKNTGAVSNPSTIVEDEELVTPGPSIVHPSVGAIPRTDAEIIASFGNLRENTKLEIPLLLNMVMGMLLPNKLILLMQGSQLSDWTELFKGKIHASEGGLSNP